MDIEEFVNGAPPGRKRSRLFPFREQIVALKSKGYTDLQIRDWLALNQIDVSREMVRKFLAKQTKQNTGETEKQANESVANSNLRKDDEVPKPAKPPLNQAEKMRAMLEEQKRDAESKHFKHDKTGNI